MSLGKRLEKPNDILVGLVQYQSDYRQEIHFKGPKGINGSCQNK